MHVKGLPVTYICEEEGVAFWTQSWQNFSLAMPKRIRQRALFAILSSKAKDEKILAVDQFELDALLSLKSSLI